MIRRWLALTYYLYALRLAALSHFYFNPLYFCSSMALLPFAEPAQIARIGSPFLWCCFIYCCLNTLIGYGAYGESLKYWDASKVSIVTTLIPVFTMIFSAIGHRLSPADFAASDMNAAGYVGALVVVCGAVLAVAGERLFGKAA